MSDPEPEILMPADPRAREGGEFVSQPAKLLRIASMVRELLEEVRKSAPDEAGRKRLRAIHGKALAALKDGLSEELQRELETLTIPREGTPSESEIRLAQAQLVGWLEGLFHGIQAALWAQHMQARAQLDEMRRRGFERAVVGLSGGVDSAVTTYLAARALGPSNVVTVRLPYRTSSPASLEHAQLVIDALGVQTRTVDISAGVDGYLANEPDADPARRGNVMARLRMVALFDLSSRYRALPLGTGNKTERLFGYFTWHADDSPPINPLGDLFKSQVWALARHLGVPEVIVNKPASADLITGQTDEGDFGISYFQADQILNWLLSGYTPDDLAVRGFDPAEIAVVRRRLESTHWKRRLPTVAMLSPTAIGESYLRPVDY